MFFLFSNIKERGNTLEIWALYLPAFHRIKENDLWWGEGFTEWDNVRKGIPLYDGHIQPQVPLDGYYDLSKVDTLRKQADLANKYGVDGFVFYHYWFKDGKKLLELPAENLLKNKDIDLKFSFCWANEPWARTWDGKNHDVLMPQDYGEYDDWISHIKYFMNFFKDERYQKINDKPVLYIYSASKIPCFDEMIKVWNAYLKENGLREIFLIEYISTFNTEVFSNLTSGVFEFEPLYTTRFDISIFNKAKRVMCKKLGVTDYQDYDSLWDLILRRKRAYSGKPIIKGCFVGWDNSPRKAKKSMIVKGNTPQKFEVYMRKLINNNRKDCLDIILINAWNEWGEGAMLEATVNDKYAYLESIKRLKEMCHEVKL